MAGWGCGEGRARPASVMNSAKLASRGPGLARQGIEHRKRVDRIHTASGPRQPHPSGILPPFDAYPKPSISPANKPPRTKHPPFQRPHLRVHSSPANTHPRRTGHQFRPALISSAPRARPHVTQAENGEAMRSRLVMVREEPGASGQDKITLHDQPWEPRNPAPSGDPGCRAGPGVSTRLAPSAKSLPGPGSEG